MHPRVDRVMDLMARWMGATPPTDPHKGSQQPAPRSLLRALKVIRYVKPNDPEAGAEGGYTELSGCCLPAAQAIFFAVCTFLV